MSSDVVEREEFRISDVSDFGLGASEAKNGRGAATNQRH